MIAMLYVTFHHAERDDYDESLTTACWRFEEESGSQEPLTLHDHHYMSQLARAKLG